MAYGKLGQALGAGKAIVDVIESNNVHRQPDNPVGPTPHGSCSRANGGMNAINTDSSGRPGLGNVRSCPQCRRYRVGNVPGPACSISFPGTHTDLYRLDRHRHHSRRSARCRIRAHRCRSYIERSPRSRSTLRCYHKDTTYRISLEPRRTSVWPVAGTATMSAARIEIRARRNRKWPSASIFQSLTCMQWVPSPEEARGEDRPLSGRKN